MKLFDDAKKVLEDRSGSYGDGLGTIELISRMWSVYLSRPVTVQDVALMMSLLKIARHKHSPNDDNLIDICGYCHLASMDEMAQIEKSLSAPDGDDYDDVPY